VKEILSGYAVYHSRSLFWNIALSVSSYRLFVFLSSAKKLRGAEGAPRHGPEKPFNTMSTCGPGRSFMVGARLSEKSGKIGIRTEIDMLDAHSDRDPDY
jgi:hypothetical protein